MYGDRRQTRLSLGLALGSPVLAVLFSVSLIALSGSLPGLSDTIGVIFFTNGAIGSIGSAAGVMLVPAAGVALRVALAVVYAAAAFFAHWFVVAVAVVMILGF